MTLKSFSFLILLASAAHAESDKKAAKAYFKKVSRSERLDVIAQATVLDPTWTPERASSEDPAAALEANCPDGFKYRAADGSLQIPTVECDYVADTGDLDGMSQKMLCRFTV